MSDYNPPVANRLFPEEYDYNFEPEKKIATISCSTDGAKKLRKIDVWSLAYVEYLLQNELTSKVNGVKIYVLKAYSKYAFESLRRRVSYLNIVDNGIKFELFHQRSQVTLDEKIELTRSEPNAITTKDIEERTHGAGAGLEKDLQDFIARDPIVVDNSRLSILSFDFYREKKSRYGVLSEVPIGIYDTIKSEETRILPTYYIDFVSFTKEGNLAVIELKVNDQSLEVISQILDYALFAIKYKDQFCKLIKNNLSTQSLLPIKKKYMEKPVKAYVVNNHFNKKFDGIFKYYTSSDIKIPFSITKIALG